ncbi:MAG: ADP-ribosylglycohydrolase family protein [Deltaproteobacteria bacterium]|nr:ADP-ribosylglycohydrolase family protein [Deltaproteobacteria bacterium]
MLGAIIGDVVGSIWEFRRIKTKRSPLFSERNGITDDGVLTVAVADALLHGSDPAGSLRDWAGRVPLGRRVGGYGQKFLRWVAAATVQPPYNSYGNGGAMRVSPAAFLADTLRDCLAMAQRVTAITHNHPEDMKGALATAHAIFLARQGETPETIRVAVPEAFTCALTTAGYEDAVRNAVSLGGDADTLAAIAGGLAEALFGIPEAVRAEGMRYLPDAMKALLVSAYAESDRDAR